MRPVNIIAPLVVWIFLCACFGGAANSGKTPFTCKAGEFVIGERGSVTCHFGRDIRDSSYHFEIVMYPFKALPSFTGYDVIRCHRQGEKPVCTTRTGYEFNGVVTENVTVSIPDVSRDVEGGYACQLIPAEGRRKEICSLTVKAKSADLISHSSASPQSDRCPEKDASPELATLILAIVFGVLLLASVLVNIILLCRTNSLRQRTRNKHHVYEKPQQSADDSAINSRGDKSFSISACQSDDEEKENHITVPKPYMWNQRRPHRPSNHPYNK